MYTIDDLNVRLLSELKEIAEEMGVKNAKKLSKQDIIYKILDQQAIAGESAADKKPCPLQLLHQRLNLSANYGHAEGKTLHQLLQHPKATMIFHLMKYSILSI